MAFQNYTDLAVWQKAMALTQMVYTLVRKLPKEEMYALASQMRRAAISIPSNIAEGRGRQTDTDFCRFLYIARGSCNEISTQLILCVQLNYLSEEMISPALAAADEVGRMLTSLILTLSEQPILAAKS